MICPWLKTTLYYRTQTRDTTTEDWGERYGDECPWYRPEYNEGVLTVKAECKRVKMEWDKAKGGDNHAD